MYMYRCAFLGCGGRARGHAEAYKTINRGQIVALCDLDENRLNSFGDRFGVPNRYKDIHEMLDKEQPDVLHIVTQPNLRASLMTIAAEHRIRACIVEKPIAVGGKDYKAIAELGKKGSTKFVVNHQLHFHPKTLELASDVNSGLIGELRFTEASARSNLSGQGTHVLELMHSFAGYLRPTSVFAQASGTSGFASSHAAPDMAEAVVTFESGLYGLLACGGNALSVGDGVPGHFHKRVAVYGTEGFVQWQMEFWEKKLKDGKYENGKKSYGAEDVIGQKGLTEAVFDWLEDENKKHPTCLENSLLQFSIILGLYASVVHRSVIKLPVEPDDNILEELRLALGG